MTKLDISKVDLLLRYLVITRTHESFFQIEEFKKWAEKLVSNNPESIYCFDTKSVTLLVAACLEAQSVQPGVMYINPLLLKEFLNTNLIETWQLMHDIGFSEEEFKEFKRETYLKFGLSEVDREWR